MKKIWTKIKGFGSDVLQGLPVIGTLVTAHKEDTKESPKGKIKITRSAVIRLSIGVGVSVLMFFGVVKMKTLMELWELMSPNG